MRRALSSVLQLLRLRTCGSLARFILMRWALLWLGITKAPASERLCVRVGEPAGFPPPSASGFASRLGFLLRGPFMLRGQLAHPGLIRRLFAADACAFSWLI